MMMMILHKLHAHTVEIHLIQRLRCGAVCVDVCCMLDAREIPDKFVGFRRRRRHVYESANALQVSGSVHI